MFSVKPIIKLIILCFCLNPYPVSAQSNPSSTGDLQSLRIAGIRFMGEPPVYIAQEKGYFTDEGLDVNVKINTAGKDSLVDLFEGRVDIITIADTPIVYQAFKRDDFLIVAGISRSETIAGALARRDHGINKPAELRGKKIGLFKGTASDYLLDQYLIAHDLSYTDITAINLKPGQLVSGIVAGDLDAIFSWQPHIHIAARQLGQNAYLLPSRGMKTLDWLVVTRRSYAQKNPEVLVKFLRALDRSTQFIAENPKQAIQLFSAASQIDIDIVDALWEEFAFGLYLSKSLLINMEDQARWEKSLKQETSPIPNYLNFIYFDALQAVKPAAISVIH